ncbi:MAG: hypoxanthine/guanine phosphoribosyltransferase [Methanomassiliicoccus sp.]|nr:hypoxanthine/guanine phosphoribosyltransferase [Methanomassiliicoccus sp.]
MLERFKASLESAPIIDVGGYDYFIHPLTDGVPRVSPAILSEVVQAMLRIGDFDCDLILGPEAMGIPLAVALSQELGVPYAVVRKRRYGLPGEIEVGQTTGYSKGKLYINGVGPGDRVVIVDDVLSTGGTLRPLILALRAAGAVVVDVLVAVEKGDTRPGLERELGLVIRALVKVEVHGGRLEVVDQITAPGASSSDTPRE